MFIKHEENRKSPWVGGLRSLHAKILEEVLNEESEFGKRVAALGLGKPNTLEIEGFPQGSGLSPILFNIAFQHAVINSLKALDSNIKIISYADDFIILSPNPLPQDIGSVIDSSKIGTKINWEKSHLFKADGVWIRDSVKFLGLTFKFPSPVSEEIIVQGTPRSGALLDYDKQLTVEKFLRRDEALKKFAKAFDLPFSPQELLDQWGMGMTPGSKVPLGIIQGTDDISVEKLQSLSSALTGMTLEEFIGQDKFPIVTKDNSADVSSAPKGTRHKTSRSQPLAGLQSRLKGLIINRLHSGSWETTMDKPVDRSLRPNGSAPEGSTWIERIQHICVKTPSLRMTSKAAMERVASRLEGYAERNRRLSIYNSTSYATLDLMRMIKHPSKIKLLRKGLRYD